MTIPLFYTVKLAPGQVFAIPLQLPSVELDNVADVAFEVALQSNEHVTTLTTDRIPLVRRDTTLYKMTFQDYDGSIHYGKPQMMSHSHGQATCTAQQWIGTCCRGITWVCDTRHVIVRE